MSLTEPQKIGRFTVQGVLGTGAQGAVYLGFDPSLERTVAIKTLRADALGDALARERLLGEARIVARLKHPNVVPLFEAGELEQGQGIYLVFEHVEGQTLARRIDGEPLPLAEAVRIMLEVLDGVSAAHAAGVLHRDLKPSNILLGPDGRARVMDFGIAMTAEAISEQNRLWGSLRYASPEQLLGAELSTRSDVFALGLLFYEMLTGQRAVQGESVDDIYEEITEGRVTPPSHLSEGGDVRYDQIVLRATARTPDDRYADAREFRTALVSLLDVRLERGSSGALDFLMRRIKRKPDFPGLSHAIRDINRLSGDAANHSVAQLANAVLQDYATTQKLLRLANSSYYGQFGGSIYTVTRAIIVLGFEQVRMAALSLMLLENLRNDSDAGQLAETLMRALYSAMIAKEVADRMPGVGGEQTFICGLLHSLGKVLTAYYFPEEYADIRLAVEQRRIPESVAAHEVLGLDYAKLGQAVLHEWGFPADIVRTLKPLGSGVLQKPSDPERTVATVSAFANELSETVFEAQGDLSAGLRGLAERFSVALGMDARQLDRLLREAREKMHEFLAGAGLPPHARKALKRLEDNLSGQRGLARKAGQKSPQEPDTNVRVEAAPPLDGMQKLDVLLEGVNDVTANLLESFDLNALLQVVLETMYRGTGARCVVLFLAARSGRHLTARMAFGDVPESLPGTSFEYSGQDGHDVFSVSLSARKDIVGQPDQRQHDLPEALRPILRADCFLVLPLVVNDRAVGAFYIDLAPGVVVDEAPMKALKTLRNQAVMAIRSASRR
ncbi:MAG: HDOD domain-containing protein [Acidihalobacter sp.]|uniref:protein kinase domain-containing protein n=1 Tax=Acidihalobacter sp. TaxID=1872108 RepID=UPI00307E307C